MTIGGLCKRVSNFGFTLLDQGYALDALPHVVTGISARISALTWARDASKSLMLPAFPRVDDYLELLREREYSFLMYDGGAVQISYQYQGPNVIKHRLLYWPCPFDAEGDFNDYDEPAVDVIEVLYLTDPRENTVLRGSIRFDYCVGSGAEFHPESHLTMSGPDCRIPVHAPMSFDTFMRFLLENFYREAWANARVKAHLAFAQEVDALAPPDGERVHVAWQYP